MLSSEEIIKDLDDTQICFNKLIDENKLVEASKLSEKLSIILTWFIQNKYVET